MKSFNNIYWNIDKHVKGGSIMKPNIGRVDALCRISMGFTILACSTAKLVRKPNEGMSLFYAMCGGMKVAEGITRFCPLTYIAEQKMVDMQQHTQNQNQTQQHEQQDLFS